MAGEGKEDLRIDLGVDYNYIFVCVCVEVSNKEEIQAYFLLA